MVQTRNLQIFRFKSCQIVSDPQIILEVAAVLFLVDIDIPDEQTNYLLVVHSLIAESLIHILTNNAQ